MSSSFGDPTRLKGKALREAEDGEGAMRLWWERYTGQRVDARPYGDLPPSNILFLFYRTQAHELNRLEALLKQRGHILSLAVEDREELRRLRKLLKAPEARWRISSLLQSDDGVVSDDPIWERYMKYAKTKSVNDIPAAWFGPGERGEKLKAKQLAREALKKAKAP